MESDPPEPSNPLEKFILKLTMSMNGYTSLARDIAKTQKALDKKLDSLLRLVNDSRASDQLVAERLTGVVSRADEIREMRMQISEVHSRLVETGAEIKITSERIRDWTPVHGIPLPSKEELATEETGINRHGILITWKTIAISTKRGVVWLLAGTGLGAGLYHLLRVLVGHA